MSVEQVRPGLWRVRWREGGRNRSRTIGRKRDAEAFDAELRRRRRMGELSGLDASEQTLAAFAEEWWELHAKPSLAPATLELYAMLLDAHIVPRLGAMRLRELTPEVVQRFRIELELTGVGRVSAAKAITLLGGLLERACEWGRLGSNAVRTVRKPPAGRARAVVPLSPAAIERMRQYLLERDRIRDATIVSLLAYAGLRPGEALALSWRAVRDRTLLVEEAVALGELSETKTHRSRSVRLLAPLAQDLAEWRLFCRRPPARELLFPARDGGPWSKPLWQNWRRRIYVPTARACGVATTRPYDLRHSFVSLLIREGHSIVDVAAQAGHSPTVALRTYAHVFEDLEPGERISAESAIRAARWEQPSGQIALELGQ